MNNYKIVKSHVIQLNWQFLVFPTKIAKSQIPSLLTIDVKNENKKQTLNRGRVCLDTTYFAEN